MEFRTHGVWMVALLMLTGCKQADGESCQVNGDCESGLICCKDSPVATPVDWGVCLSQPDCDAVPEDTSTDNDTISPDTEEDSTVSDPADDTLAPDTTEDTLVGDTLVEDTLVEDTLVEDTLVEDTTPDTPADTSADIAGDDAVAD
jgi:hypothetical protein